MTITNPEYTKKKTFVSRYLAPCLKAAKPHLAAEYCIGSEIKLRDDEKPFYENAVFPSEEYVVVEANGDYRYFVNVTAGSLVAIAETVFAKMACK